jgi:RES domain-containing protein
MVYSSSSIALAVLETIVHLGAGVFPMNRYIIEIEVLDDEFVKRKIVGSTDLPDAWDSNPASFKSKDFGTNWINLNSELVLQVPSAIVPLESNFLLNPLHSGIAKIRAKNLGKYVYDPRSVPGFTTP